MLHGPVPPGPVPFGPRVRAVQGPDRRTGTAQRPRVPEPRRAAVPGAWARNGAPPPRPPRRRRLPPLRRRDLPGIYLAVLVFGLLAAQLPMPPPSGPPVAGPPAAPAPPPAVQVRLVAPGPVAPRAEVLNALAPHVVALTFDDGPDPRYTPRVLEILRRHGALATFCMVSGNVPGNEALVRQVVAEGHRLCDHSHTHDVRLPQRDAQRLHDEVVGAGRALAAAAGGAPVEWFRAPGGAWSPDVTALAVRHGMQPVGWNVDPRDWKRADAATLVAAVQEQVRAQEPDGVIVLLHDGGGDREQTVLALEQLVPWFAAQGYGFAFPVP